MTLNPLAILWIASLAAAGSLTDPQWEGRTYHVHIPSLPDERFTAADYRMWLPPGLKRVRGLIIRQHGCGDPAALSGLDHAGDAQWQALAARHGMALLAVRIPTRDAPCSNWSDPANGSGAALQRALDRLADASGHAEIMAAPWAIWGHSGGAAWALRMMAAHPERTVAIVAMRCSAALGEDPRLLGIPVLLATGRKEEFQECRAEPLELFRRFRAKGAPWAYAEEADAGHESGDTRHLAAPFLDAVFRARLPEDGQSLRPIGAGGFAGNLATHAVDTAAAGTGSAWLPDAETARRWAEYGTTGEVTFQGPPRAPVSVTVNQSDSNRVVFWDYRHGHEREVPGFRIYVGGRLARELRPPGHNYGDAPQGGPQSRAILPDVIGRVEVASFDRGGESNRASAPL